MTSHKVKEQLVVDFIKLVSTKVNFSSAKFAVVHSWYWMAEDRKVEGEIEESEQQIVLSDNLLEEDDDGLDPIERITKSALRMCDLSYERAFAIDDHNLGRKLGEYTMSRLMEIFFDRVYKDPEDWFRYATDKNKITNSKLKIYL